MNLKKTALTSAVALALGTTSMLASATTVLLTASWTGYFTMVNSTGSILKNTDLAGTDTVFSGYRTPVTGTMQFCAYVGGTNTSCGALSAGQGSATLVPFSFFGGGLANATGINMEVIGSGPLVLANMGFNWNGTNGIPVSLVMDASGFFGAFQNGLMTSSTVAGVGVYAATENTRMAGTTTKPTLMPIGPVPMASTTWNTTTIAGAGLGSNPSGTLPLVADSTVDSASCNLVGTSCGATLDTGIGGSPMIAGPFPAFNANFDITSMHVTSIWGISECGDCATPTEAVPVPAAAWLFGSGLLGLIGVARRKRS